MADHTPTKPSVPWYQYERLSVKEMAKDCRVSGQTIRDWCRDFGIGAKFQADQWTAFKWHVSYAAAKMVAAKDKAAFDAFCANDRGTEHGGTDLVDPYLYENRFDGQ